MPPRKSQSAKKLGSASDKNWFEEVEKPKFSNSLTSDIIVVTVAKTKVFNIHSDLLIAASERYHKELTGSFKEAITHTIDVEDEDPELFGFFVEYIYRNRSILSRDVQHYSEFVTLARLYAMGDRLMARPFKESCLWRFTVSLGQLNISEEGICSLLEIACLEISERVREDPMRSQIFWYSGTQIATLQKSSMFRQLLQDIPDVGRQLCLWVFQMRPELPTKPNGLLCERFGPESEYKQEKIAESAPRVKTKKSERKNTAKQSENMKYIVCMCRYFYLRDMGKMASQSL